MPDSLAVSNATVLLVHGAWHGAWCWPKIQAGLADRGVPAVAVDLPGHGLSSASLGDLYGDAAATAAVARSIAGPIVLVGHSYGGAVITEAAADTSDAAHLVYLAAFCADVGESVGELARREVPDPASLGKALIPNEDGSVLTLDPAHAPSALYNTCTAENVAYCLPRLCGQPSASFAQPIRTASWRTTPSTYVVCEQDRAIPPSLQRQMATRCTATLTLNCDHSPFLSMPDPVIELLAKLAADHGR